MNRVQTMTLCLAKATRTTTGLDAASYDPEVAQSRFRAGGMAGTDATGQCIKDCATLV